MPRVFRRTIGVGAVVALLLAALPVQAAASAEGPRLAVVAWSLRRPPSVGLLTTDQQGGAPEQLLTRGPHSAPLAHPLTAPSWSSDGQTLAFTAIIGQTHGKFSTRPRTKIFTISADGGEPRPVPGTNGGLNPVFAPDGHTIAFSIERRRLRPNGHGGGDVAYESESIWLADVAGGGRVQLTPWRDGLRESPSSFSPNGSTLAATRQVRDGGGDAVGIQLSSGATTVIADDALEPVYSPNGSEIAFLKGRRRTVSKDNGATTATVTDLFAMRTDGTEVRRLTRTPKAVELYPSWDPSGDRIVLTRLGDPFTGAGFLGLGGAIVEINRDGTCPTKVIAAPHIIYAGATWQPGPGREAGPIPC